MFFLYGWRFPQLFGKWNHWFVRALRLSICGNLQPRLFPRELQLCQKLFPLGWVNQNTRNQGRERIPNIGSPRLSEFLRIKLKRESDLAARPFNPMNTDSRRALWFFHSSSQIARPPRRMTARVDSSFVTDSDFAACVAAHVPGPVPENSS